MELDKFLIGFVVFTLFVVSGVYLIADVNYNYGFINASIGTDDFGSVYNTTDHIYNLSQSQKNSIFGSSVDEDDAESSMFKGGYKTLRFLRNSFGLINNIITAIATKVGIPRFMVDMAIASITIAVIFSIVYIIFRIPRRN